MFLLVTYLVVFLLPLSTIEGGQTQFTAVYANVLVNSQVVTIVVPCSGTSYDGVNGRGGCTGEKYDYSTITTPPSWPVTYNSVSYTQAQHTAYWDWVYSGYGGGGAADWSQNCHGYGFGVGDWPDNSSTIISANGTNCWILDMSNATIADNTNHTVKITVLDCPLSVGLVITSSAEKFRESAVYTKTGNCASPISLQGGNSPRGGMSFNYYRTP